MAFQPIVNIDSGEIFAHEALVRGPQGEGAGAILGAVDAASRYVFDQQCRVRSIEMAAALNLGSDGARLSMNFTPGSIYEPRACIRLTLEAARRTGLAEDRIIFEFTENEKLDTPHVLNILRTYSDMGFMTAIDDFGAGHAGLALLTKFTPDIVKLDMDLIRGIDQDPVRRSIVRHVCQLLEDLGVDAVCEGVETREELLTLQDLGVRLMQGYFLARPAFESLVEPGAIQAALAITPRRAMTHTSAISRAGDGGSRGAREVQQ
jgi:EAL domain-containing protein (putative c-di-GMP-specific phosphodiesterase class I)